MAPNSVVMQTKKEPSARLLLFSQRSFKCRPFVVGRHESGKECLMKHHLDLMAKRRTFETCKETPRTHVRKLAKSLALFSPLCVSLLKSTANYFARRERSFNSDGQVDPIIVRSVNMQSGEKLFNSLSKIFSSTMKVYSLIGIIFKYSCDGSYSSPQIKKKKVYLSGQYWLTPLVCNFFRCYSYLGAFKLIEFFFRNAIQHFALYLIEHILFRIRRCYDTAAVYLAFFRLYVSGVPSRLHSTLFSEHLVQRLFTFRQNSFSLFFERGKKQILSLCISNLRAPFSIQRVLS